jgi:retron-type reverse transcriptase
VSFDSVPWGLVMKAAGSVCDLPWVLLYVRRWLAAPLQQADGTLTERHRGTPQGGLCEAEHNDPYAQCWLMRSGLPFSW